MDSPEGSPPLGRHKVVLVWLCSPEGGPQPRVAPHQGGRGGRRHHRQVATGQDSQGQGDGQVNRWTCGHVKKWTGERGPRGLENVHATGFCCLLLSEARQNDSFKQVGLR